MKTTSSPSQSPNRSPNPRPGAPRPAARRSRPVWPALALTVLVAAGAAAGATAVFSSQTQQTTEDFTRKLSSALNRSGMVTAQQTGYQKGFGSSTQTMKVSIEPGKSGTGKPLELLVTNHIKHGPFPGMQGVGRAVVDTDIRFADPQLQAQFDKAFGGQKPRIHTLIGLTGDTHTDVQVPGGSLSEQGSSLNWKPLLAHINVAGKRTDTDLNWPGLTFSGEDGQGQIAGVSLSSNTQKASANDPLGTGTSSFKVASLEFNDEKDPVHLANMVIGAETSLSGGQFYDSLVRYDVGQVRSGTTTLNNVQFHLGLRHLAREPLERIMQVFNDVQQSESAQTSSTPELTEAQNKQLETDVQTLLRGAPRLTLDRLSISQPSGEVVLSGQASAPRLAGMSAQDLQMMSQQPAILASLLDVHLEATGRKQAVSELMNLFGGEKPGEADQTVESLVSEGYATEQGDQLKTVFDLKEGRPTLNGQAMGN